MEQPTPLQDYIVNLTLQYLLPPSGPLPLHLVSKQSLQRHHFLNIDPSDSESYFCWPSGPSSKEDSASVIRTLELYAGNQDLLEKQGHQIQYDADDENLRARVSIGPNVHLIFMWQNTDESGHGGWRYHDAKLSANSSSSGFGYSSFDPALRRYLSSSTSLSTLPSESENAHSRSSSPSSDAYWGNYGATSSQGSPEQDRNLDLPTADSAEDAYWNSYSSVQGTADSTIPSPKVGTRVVRTPRHAYDQQQMYTHQEEADVIPRDEERYEYEPDVLPSRYYASGEQQQPEKERDHHESEYESSERVLRSYIPGADLNNFNGADENQSHAERLARALFPILSLQELSESSESALERGAGAGALHSKAEDGSVGLLSPPLSNEEDGAGSGGRLGEEESPGLLLRTVPYELEDKSVPSGVDALADAALSESIRGLYSLWVARRPSSSSSSALVANERSKLRKEFLALASRALSS